MATDLYQESIKESISSSKKVVDTYKSLLDSREVSGMSLFIMIIRKIYVVDLTTNLRTSNKTAGR